MKKLTQRQVLTQRVGVNPQITQLMNPLRFKLIAKLPVSENYKDYKEYAVTFNDTMSNGVTFESIESVTVDGVKINSSKYNCTAAVWPGGRKMGINN